MLATVPPVYYIPLICCLSQIPWASWESLPLSQECLFISSPCSAWRDATSACEPLKADLYKQEMFSSHSPFLLKSSSTNPLAKVIKTMYLINGKSIPKSRAWWAKYFLIHPCFYLYLHHVRVHSYLGLHKYIYDSEDVWVILQHWQNLLLEK